MITLKLALITMMVGSNMLPMHVENIHTNVQYPKAQIEMVNEDILPLPEIAKSANKEEFVAINQNKTYEECMKEAFERAYEEVNRMLDEVVDNMSDRYSCED